MKEYTVTLSDLATIKEAALKHYVDKAIKNDYFMAECYLTGVITLMNSKQLVLKDGKLYEKTKKSD
jgi:hypothetical protein